MQLALDMGATLEELNQRMSSKEFSLWVALHNMQPWGVGRDNFHFAMVCNILANRWAPKGRQFSVSDFMHEDQETKKDRSTQQALDYMRSVAKPKENN